MERSAFSLSGGIIWHVRAARFLGRWRGFVHGVHDWLLSWQHESENLLLLGPSAGWCLPDDLLTKFRQIVAVDLDPLAPVLFGWRHGRAMRASGTSIKWLRLDVFTVIDDLLARYPAHAVLFCNLLGQHFVCSRNVEETTRELARVSRLLHGRKWASFHDRLSRPWQDGVTMPREFTCAGRTTSMEVARLAGVAGVWHDHLTGEILPAAAHRHYFSWPITPQRMHIIEAGWGA